MKPAGLYIHFPFCRRACFYCHFYKRPFRAGEVGAWLRLACREMGRRRDPDLEIDSVYFGGGSPSLLAPGQVAKLLQAAAKHFRLAPRPEVTLEANPEDLSPSWLAGLLRAGVNRLSIGVQSFLDQDLRFLRRSHDAAVALAAVAMAGEAGLANVGIDLMIGLPTQGRRSLEANLRRVDSLRPAHVSVYILEGVPRPESGERDARLYLQVQRALSGLGYRHYEVSNYCRRGRASRHNLKYWRMGRYVGIGPSAAGFLGGRDYRNVSDLGRYAAAVGRGALPERPTRRLEPLRRRIVTGLRLLQGLPASAFAPFPGETAFLLQEGLLVRRSRNYAVPEDKILLLNEILGYFV